MIFSKTAKTVTISGRYDLGLPIVEQFVVMTVVGESRDQAEDRRDDEKEKGQHDGTNRYYNLHVRPNHPPYETS